MASGRRDPTLASPSPVRRPCGQLTAGRDPADERSRTGSGRLAPPCPLIRRCAGATYLLMHVPRSAGGWFAGGDRGKRGELAESGAGVEGVGTAAARDRRGCNTRRDATQPGVWCAISAAFCVFVIPRGYRPIPGRAPLNTPHWPTRRCKPADEAAHLGHGFLQRNDHAFRFVDVGQWLPRVRTGEAAGNSWLASQLGLPHFARSGSQSGRDYAGVGPLPGYRKIHPYPCAAWPLAKTAAH